MPHISSVLLMLADKVLRLSPVALIWQWCCRCNAHTGHSLNESLNYPGRRFSQCEECGHLKIEK